MLNLWFNVGKVQRDGVSVQRHIDEIAVHIQAVMLVMSALEVESGVNVDEESPGTLILRNQTGPDTPGAGDSWIASSWAGLSECRSSDGTNRTDEYKRHNETFHSITPSCNNGAESLGPSTRLPFVRGAKDLHRLFDNIETNSGSNHNIRNPRPGDGDEEKWGFHEDTAWSVAASSAAVLIRRGIRPNHT